jgi:hypothetical protein
MPVVTITATGLDTAITPNNFTVSIINYTGGTTVYATNISRATLISGYNVTVEPGDETVKVTSTGTCTSFVDVNVSTLALQSYRPSPVMGTTSLESPDSFDTSGGKDGSGISVEVIIGDTIVYSFMNEADFALTHVSTIGGTSTGPFLPGSLAVSKITTNLELYGMSKTSYIADNTVNTSTYRLTYTPSGLSRDFNYYWIVAAPS